VGQSRQPHAHRRHRNFGCVPEAAELSPADAAVLAAVEGGFAHVGDLIESGRFKAALGEAMALAARVNQYASDQAPWTLVKEDRARAATVLFVALRCVDSLKVLLAPFLPFTSQALHEMLGYEDALSRPLEFHDVDEGEGERHVILTGDYGSWGGVWLPSQLPPGRVLREPRPLFRKLDPGVADEELERMRPPE
jgi:methionyl-tRNA synthetase